MGKARDLVARKMPKVLRRKDFYGHDDIPGVGHDAPVVESDDNHDLEIVDYE